MLWSQSYDRGPGEFQYPGTRTPTIDGDRIYTYGSAGDLVCRQLADGKEIWRLNVLQSTHAKPVHWGQASSPLVTDDLVYVMGGVEGSAIAVAVDKMTGKIVWGSEAKGVGNYATVIMVDVEGQKQLIAPGGDAIYAMDPKTGKTIWSVPFSTPNAINAAMPIFDGKHLFMSAAYGHGAVILAVTANSAKVEWEEKDLQCRFQPPILDGDIMFCNSEGKLKCLNWTDRKTLWSSKPDFKLGIGGSLVRDGDKLIVMSEHGKLMLLHADASGFKIISQKPVFDYDKVWSTPLIYRGKLYAMGKDPTGFAWISVPTPPRQNHRSGSSVFCRCIHDDFKQIDGGFIVAENRPQPSKQRRGIIMYPPISSSTRLCAGKRA